MVRRLAAQLTVILLAGPASAETALTPRQFLALADGRTLTFVEPLTGAPIGAERFLGVERTVWARSDGSCAHGTITVRGGQVCYSYDDEPPDARPHCWHVLRDGPDLFVRQAGSAWPQEQQIAAITDEPLSCDGVPVS